MCFRGGYGGAPTIADFDGDGRPEIAVAGASSYTVFDTDGSILWSSPTQDYSSTVTGSTSFDFDGDGAAEVVYRDERFLRIYRGSDGQVLHARPVLSGTGTEMPVVADIDNDGHAELLVCSDARIFNGNPAVDSGVYAFESANDDWAPTRAIWNQHSYHITNINDDGTIPTHEQPSWLVHNTYRLNAFPGRDPLALPDLSVSLLRFDQTSQRPRLTVRVGNGGLTPTGEARLTFYQGDPAVGGILLGDQIVAPLAVGEYRDLSLDAVELFNQNELYVVVDAANAIDECNEVNNQMAIPLATLATVGSLTVATDAPTYTSDATAHLSALILNTGALSGTFTAVLQVEDSNGQVVTRFDDVDLENLSVGTSHPIGVDWPANGILTGDYQLHGLLYDDRGEPIDEDLAPFQIVSTLLADRQASLRTTTDRAEYNANDLVRIDNLLRNLSTDALFSDITLQVQVVDPRGTDILRQGIPIGQLAPGQQTPHGLTLPLSGAEPGAYQVHAQAVDIRFGLLATDEAGFTVAQAFNRSLNGLIETEKPQVVRGEANACMDRLSTLGGTLTNLEIRQRLVNLETGEVVLDRIRNLDTLNGDAPEHQEAIDTAELPPGNYACLLQARPAPDPRRLRKADEDWQTLSYAYFQVVLPQGIVEPLAVPLLNSANLALLILMTVWIGLRHRTVTHPQGGPRR